MEILSLAGTDILAAVSPGEIMDTIEQAMVVYEQGEVYMPPRMHLAYGDNDMLLLMPCFTKKGFGTKLVTVFPENSKYDAAVTNGVVLLNKAETGEPIALINGFVLTALRTAAVGSVSIRHLADDNATKLGLVGAGVQGYYQALFAAQTRPIKDIYVFSRTAGKIGEFLEKLGSALPEVRLHQAPSPETLLEASDIVITATTSNEPVLPDEPNLYTGKHFVGIGSFRPQMREFPAALFKEAERVFVDTEHALEETGDLIIPLAEGWLERSRIQTLGRFLLDRKENSSLSPAYDQDVKKATTFFKSVGMALFDLMAGQLVYEKAVENGLGQTIHL